jgi:NDP-4-keto-2,6-dideoxyhexose 3-C-methyltransferase
MYCKNCKKNKLKKIVKLEKQPISSVFLSKKKFNLKKYSLDLYECNSCKLVQFSSLPPLGDMYGETYGYRTSLSNLMVNHMKNKFIKIIKNKKILNNKNLILDIGSNDGTFLNFFAKKNKNLQLYGIDPSSEKFSKYYNENIELVTNFFSYKNLKKHIKDEKIIKNQFSLITSFAMFYDIDKPNDFCEDISKLLDKNGEWISEFSYFPLLIKNLTYDQICHEHVTYYTLTTFQNIVSKNGLKIIDLSFNEINGGSIEVVCCKKNSKKIPNYKKINEVLNDEKNIDHQSYERLNLRVRNTKKILQTFVREIGKKNIIGYGAATKGNIILNQCEFTEKDIPYICDENPYKFGKYTPGSNIPIISKKKMRTLKPKYLLILIWSFRSEVIKQEKKYIENGGSLVFHLPILHIVDKSNYKEYLNKDFKAFSFNY